MSDTTASKAGSQGYATAQAAEFAEQVRKLANAGLRVRFDLAHLADQLKVPRARTFANEGLGRRLRVIERCGLNIFETYPPDRKSFLSMDECDDVAIQLHAFVINVYALFDNAAWVCMLEAGAEVPPVKVGVFKAECQHFIPPRFRDYLAQPTLRQWHRDYGKVYRDSTAHRIAPYLPSRAYTPEEGERWRKLHKESMQELLGAGPNLVSGGVAERLKRHGALSIEKESLGSNSLLIALSLTGNDASPPVYMHPQVLCDWALTHELISEFTGGMRHAKGWQLPPIPPMQFG